MKILSSIVFLKFCVLCGQTKQVNSEEYIPKKLLFKTKKELNDLGFICDKCNEHLANGNTFKRH